MASIGAQSNMFDKVAKVEFIISTFFGDLNDTFDETVTIFTPQTGRKQDIHIKGMMTGSTQVQGFELRLKNFYTDKLLSDFKALKITAGYKNGNQAVIYGSILNAYVETPPPDSISVFQVLNGDLQIWSTAWLYQTYQPSTTAQSIFQNIATALGVNLNWKVKTMLVTQNTMDFNCLCQDAIDKIKKAFPTLVVRIDYKELTIFEQLSGTGVIFLLDYIKSAKKDSSGFTLSTIWNPAIRPGDVVQANPLYYKQDFGGQNISNVKFQVITHSFEFDTINTNDATLTSVATQ